MDKMGKFFVSENFIKNQILIWTRRRYFKSYVSNNNFLWCFNNCLRLNLSFFLRCYDWNLFLYRARFSFRNDFWFVFDWNNFGFFLSLFNWFWCLSLSFDFWLALNRSLNLNSFFLYFLCGFRSCGILINFCDWLYWFNSRYCNFCSRWSNFCCRWRNFCSRWRTFCSRWRFLSRTIHQEINVPQLFKD